MRQLLRKKSQDRKVRPTAPCSRQQASWEYCYPHYLRRTTSAKHKKNRPESQCHCHKWFVVPLRRYYRPASTQQPESSRDLVQRAACLSFEWVWIPVGRYWGLNAKSAL